MVHKITQVTIELIIRSSRTLPKPSHRGRRPAGRRCAGAARFTLRQIDRLQKQPKLVAANAKNIQQIFNKSVQYSTQSNIQQVADCALISSSGVSSAAAAVAEEGKEGGGGVDVEARTSYGQQAGSGGRVAYVRVDGHVAARQQQQLAYCGAYRQPCPAVSHATSCELSIAW